MKKVNNGGVEPLIAEYKPITRGHEAYARAIRENSVTIVIGPAGTSKTYSAVGVGSEYLKASKIDKMVLTRPIVDCGREFGWLSGSMREKIDPYMRPMLDAFNNFYSKDDIERMIKRQAIELMPLEMMRGLSYSNAVLFCDEAQNALWEQLVMFLTRLGKGSKAILAADLDQSDLKIRDLPINRIIEKLSGMPNFRLICLTEEDIVRSGIVGEILRRLYSK